MRRENIGGRVNHWSSAGHQPHDTIRNQSDIQGGFPMSTIVTDRAHTMATFPSVPVAKIAIGFAAAGAAFLFLFWFSAYLMLTPETAAQMFSP
jgi:hypothetical protein